MKFESLLALRFCSSLGIGGPLWRKARGGPQLQHPKVRSHCGIWI